MTAEIENRTGDQNIKQELKYQFQSGNCEISLDGKEIN